jgi:hypothetical protein
MFLGIIGIGVGFGNEKSTAEVEEMLALIEDAHGNLGHFSGCNASWCGRSISFKLKCRSKS